MKLVPKEGADIPVGSEINDLKRVPLAFGLFSQDILKSGEPSWAIIRFDPYSKDTGFNNDFSNREEALKSAIKYLGEKGFNANSFDLEGLKDAI